MQEKVNELKQGYDLSHPDEFSCDRNDFELLAERSLGARENAGEFEDLYKALVTLFRGVYANGQTVLEVTEIMHDLADNNRSLNFMAFILRKYKHGMSPEDITKIKEAVIYLSSCRLEKMSTAYYIVVSSAQILGSFALEDNT